MHSPMDSPPSLSISPPTPSPATAIQVHHRHLEGPPSTARKKRNKAFTFNLQRPNKPKPPTRKPDPTAPKITMPCSECGKKFWSWKALYGHMRCHPDRQWRGINPPPNLQRPENSLEIISMTPEDHEAASCLLLLAMGSYDDAVVELRHTCGICLKVFPSGQALGGHKRCHWEKPDSNLGGFGGGLDLNLPADVESDEVQLVLRLGL